LRVLGNLLDIGGFDYLSSEEVRDELQAALGDLAPDNRYSGKNALARSADRATGRSAAIHATQDADVPMYEVDAIVRRAVALQLTPEAKRQRHEQTEQESAA
ncbi:MAG: NADH-quinone oxidoreductase subunit NuoG, partial [Woeseiaceae bacterium]